MNTWKVLINGMNANYKEIDINNLVETWLYDIKLRDSNFKPRLFY